MCPVIIMESHTALATNSSCSCTMDVQTTFNYKKKFLLLAECVWPCTIRFNWFMTLWFWHKILKVNIVVFYLFSVFYQDMHWIIVGWQIRMTENTNWDADTNWDREMHIHRLLERHRERGRHREKVRQSDRDDEVVRWWVTQSCQLAALTSCPGCLLRKESSVRQQQQRAGTLRHSQHTALHSLPALFWEYNERYSSRWHFKSPLQWPHNPRQICRLLLKQLTSEHNAWSTNLSHTQKDMWSQNLNPEGGSCFSSLSIIHTSSMADALIQSHLQHNGIQHFSQGPFNRSQCRPSKGTKVWLFSVYSIYSKHHYKYTRLLSLFDSFSKDTLSRTWQISG